MVTRREEGRGRRKERVLALAKATRLLIMDWRFWSFADAPVPRGLVGPRGPSRSRSAPQGSRIKRDVRHRPAVIGRMTKHPENWHRGAHEPHYGDVTPTSSVDRGILQLVEGGIPLL